MIIKKNTKLIARKQHLLRALNTHNISEADYNKEMPELEKQIAINLKEALEEAYSDIRENINVVKKTISDDGDFKRCIAKIIISFLEDNLSKEEVKGVMRQGYKIMRGKS